MKYLSWTIVMATAALLFFSSPAIGEEEPNLTDDDVHAWLSQNIPESLKYLDELKIDDPREYANEIDSIVDEILYLDEIKATDLKLFERLLEAHKMDITSWKMAEAYEAETDPEKKKKIETDLRDLLGRIFDIRLEEKEKNIEELEKELKELRDLVERRKKLKEQVINRHLKELLDLEDEAMSWW